MLGLGLDAEIHFILINEFVFELFIAMLIVPWKETFTGINTNEDYVSHMFNHMHEKIFEWDSGVMMKANVIVLHVGVRFYNVLSPSFHFKDVFCYKNRLSLSLVCSEYHWVSL